MNIDIKNIQAKLQPILNFLKKYVAFIFVITVFFVLGFFVLRINQLSRIEPDSSAVDEKLQSVKQPHIDTSVVNKINDLQTQNIQVQSLFDQARSNPFDEQH